MPEILGFIGPERIRGIKDERHVKKILARKLTKKYYDKDNVFLSGLKLGSDTYFAELIVYLHLNLHIVLAVKNQLDALGRSDRAKFNRIIKCAYSTYEIFTIPDYRIKKKERKKIEREFGKGYLKNQILIKANKFIVDQSDKLLFVWDGKRAGSNTYKTLKYAEEQEKKVDVIHISTRFNLE